MVSITSQDHSQQKNICHAGLDNCHLCNGNNSRNSRGVALRLPGYLVSANLEVKHEDKPQWAHD